MMKKGEKNMESYKKIFIYCVNMLIDEGIHETIEEIERQCRKGVIYDYLMTKYADKTGGDMLAQNKHLYQHDVNAYMANTVDMRYRAQRSYGISNPESGLLMLVNFVVDNHD